MATAAKYIVVIGGSAGGLNALRELVYHLEKGKNTAYCIVLHLSRKGIGDFLVHRLRQVTTMPCSMDEDGALIESDNIYVARPNQHLLVKEGHLKLGDGTEENRWRPSIDVLFRSAAVAYSTHVIGVVLSGLLDDGTSGMSTIKKSGGVCVVQDPNHAEFPDMPMSVINNMEVDHVASLSEMGPLITNITEHMPDDKGLVPMDVVIESRIAEQVASGIENIDAIGERSVFACPDCGGSLWEMRNDDTLKRYRCHIGHTYTQKDLVLKQTETTGNTLWVALRMMEERKHMLKKLEVDSKERGYSQWTAVHVEKQAELDTHINKLKEIIHDLQNYDIV